MGDPFDLFDEGPFGGSLLGPRKILFPFTVAREEDGTWLLTATTPPYRAATAGTAAFTNITLTLPLITRVREGRDRFGRPAHVPTLQPFSLTAPPVTLTILAPPSTGRPVSFCGAIGSNITAQASLDTHICTAGDPLILTLELTGAKDTASVHPPPLGAVLTNAAFRLDEASVKTDTIPGGRRFTWRVRAVKAGTCEFPALPVSFFNPVTRTYQTVRTDAIPVQIKAGVQAALDTSFTDGSDDEAPFPVPDGLDLDPAGARPRPLLPHLPLILLLLLSGPFTFAVFHLLPPLRRRLSAHHEAARRTQAFSVCRRALRKHDLAVRQHAIRRFFSVRYRVNGATVTAADAARLMAPDYTAEEIALITAVLNEADQVQYAVRQPSHLVRTALFLLLTGLPFLARTADFTYQRANTLASRAIEPAAFRAATDAYRTCLRENRFNPVLLANLGAVALFAEEPRLAQAAFFCAEQYTGETPSTRRGLKAAFTRLKNDPRLDLPPARALLRPHFLFSLDTRLLAAALAWFALWLIALLPPGPFRKTCLTLILVFFLTTLLSCAVSYVGFHQAERTLCHEPR